MAGEILAHAAPGTRQVGPVDLGVARGVFAVDFGYYSDPYVLHL